MNIIPPELLGDSSKSTDTSKKFDRSEFFPSSLTDGESNSFRLLGHYGTGHAAVYWRYPVEQMKDGELRFAGYRYTAEYPGAQPKGVARAVDWSNPARPKLDNEFCKAKKALVWIAWSNERQRPELLILEQRSLRDGIVEALGDEDFGFKDDGTAEFLLKVTRLSNGLRCNQHYLGQHLLHIAGDLPLITRIQQLSPGFGCNSCRITWTKRGYLLFL